MATIPPGGGSPGGNKSVKMRKQGWYMLATTALARGGPVTGFSAAWLTSSQATKYPSKKPSQDFAGVTAVGPFPSKNSAQAAASDAQKAGEAWWTTAVHDLGSAAKAFGHAVNEAASDLNPLNILGAEIERGLVAFFRDLWRAIGPWIIAPVGVLLIILGFLLFFKNQISGAAGMAGQVAMMVAK